MNLSKLLKIILGLCLLISMSESAMAAACSSSISPYVTDCDGSGVIWTTGPLVINSGVTLSDTNQFRIQNAGSTFINNGVITNSANGGTAVTAVGAITSIINNGSITGSYAAIDMSTSGSFANNGSLTGTTYGVYNASSISSFVNTSLITGSIGIENIGTITSLTNTGTISGGIENAAFLGGIIRTLNNSQGASSTALAYSRNLPTNYNIIINSPSNYGQLAGSNIVGATNFGIYAGSLITTKLYAGVLQGFSASNVGPVKSGSFGNFAWTLALESGSSTVWDLIFSGASTADTQQSLVNTASALQNSFTLQNSVLANSFSYDCNVFGENDVCVSAGGRNTAVSAANGLNNTSALLIAAYKVHSQIRIGAYADQNLSMNQAGNTVNLGNNTPLIGLFGAWNERLDGAGTEVKVSAAYGQKNTTVTRQVVGTSEPGSGSSQLNSQGAQITAKYGFALLPEVIVSPYAGIRYTQNNMGGYTEGTSASVTAPLTYSALNTNATTALAGVGASYRGIPKTNLFASAGVETDTNTQNGSINATGVTGLTPVNFNVNPVKTRPTAMVGATYDVAKNQRLGITGIYRQEAYQSVQTTTVMATYTVGL